MTEVAEKLSAATGKTIHYVNVPPEAARQAQLASGMPPYLADALFELFAERRNDKEGKVWPDTAALLGRPPTSFDEFARRNAAAFRGEAAAPEV
jgi:nucleotide-binding universal stress UspA family protein